MMGEEKPPQPSLFYGFNLEKRVPADHPLRVVARTVDFSFVSALVEPLYGGVGNPSIPPPTILRLMFLLAFYDVRSERALFEALPLRLDWLWFLGMDLDTQIPDHSVLSKARARWGTDAFRKFFERTVDEAVQKGLVDGKKIFCDGSLFDANASRKSVETVGVVDLSAASDELEHRLDAASIEPRRERRSTTDPDAAVVTKPGAGPARPRYKSHRAIDDRCGVITATEVTPGDTDEGHMLESLINQHEHNTECELNVAVADTQYGTTENYLMCLDRAIEPHIRPMGHTAEIKQQEKGLFGRDQFQYDEQSDRYVCPAGKELRRVQKRADRNATRYAPKQSDCQQCELREMCTRGKRRSITRHLRQDEIDSALAVLDTPEAKQDLRRRKHFMERSFAIATRYGFKKCRWRGLELAEIHELLIAIVQNVQILIGGVKQRPRATAAASQISRVQGLLHVRDRLARSIARCCALVPARPRYAL
jgi:transposase